MIDVDRLTVRAGTFQLSEVSLQIPAGRYGVLMGRTGSGKTTVLEAVCGLKHVVCGAIRLSGRDVTRLPPAARGIGFVPQDGALFSTMSIREHLCFALRIRHWPQQQMDQRIEELSRLLRLEHLLSRSPGGLSGGERQRVALGRALSFGPSILCLDEPLSALDEETRDEMIQLLKRVQRETQVTALHVTHSRTEARELADRCLRIEDGKISEIAP